MMRPAQNNISRPEGGAAMLKQVNQKLGEWYGRAALAVRAVAGKISPVLHAVVGEWSPPTWVRATGKGLGWVGSKVQAYALLSTLFVAVAAAGIWKGPYIAQHWRAWAPAWMNVGLIGDDLGAPSLAVSLRAAGVPDYVNNGGPQPLVVSFNAPAAPPVLIGREPTDLQLSPEIAGKWVWVDDKTLRFEPKSQWPIGEHYTLKIGRKTLASHVALDQRSLEFNTPAFEPRLASAEFYQDPTQVGVRRVVLTLSFNHPVDAKSLESRIHLDDGSQRKFSVSYDAKKLEATVQSEPLPIPAETTAMSVLIDSGVKSSVGGQPTSSPLKQSVDVPGLYSLAINAISASIVSDENGDPQHVLHVGSSMAVHEREYARTVQAWMLPISDKEGGDMYPWSDTAEVTAEVLKRAKPLKLEAIPSEREVTEDASFRMPQAEGGRFIYVRVAKGMKSPGGYMLGNDRGEILQIKTFAPELSIMSQGSLLALSGEKKLPLLVRDVPGVVVDIARVLPYQLHMLVSQAEGSFSRPHFYGKLDEDYLAEHFERKIPMNARPGKSHYETVDFADFLNAGGERRGVFLLKVHGYDPKAKESSAGSEDADPDPSEGNTDDEEGGYGYRGGYCCGAGEGDGQSSDPTQVEDQRLVIVTDLGLIAKRAADGSRDVFVQSIATGQPVANARIEVWGRNGLVLTSATTDAGGHATVGNLNGFTRERAPILLLARKDGDLSFLPLGGAASMGRGDRTLDMSRFDVGGLRTSGVPNQMTGYVFSDRGIYRPGDTFHVGIVVNAGNWSTSLKDLPVEIEVTDPRGLSVRRETIRLGTAGTAEIAHTTQESSPTGNYSVTLSLPRQTNANAPDVSAVLLGSTNVKVQEFLPDRTRVVAHLSTEVPEGWVSPNGLQATVHAENLFGTPAQARRVTGVLTLSPTVPSFRSYLDFSFYDASKNVRSQSEELGDTQTDDQGDASFDLGLEKLEAATYRAHVLVKTFEPAGGRSVAAEVQTLVSDRPYLVGLKSTESLSYVSRNARREVQILAINPKAQKTAVSGLKLVRVEHRVLSVLVKQSSGLYRYESREKDVTLEEQPYTVPAMGGKIVLNTSTPGNFALEVRDGEGRVLNRVQYTVAGAANLSRSLDRNAELQIKLNKASYQPGDDIELSIQAPYVGAGLITIERDKVYAHAWFKTDKTASVQHITLPKGFEGTGYVNVQFIRDPSSDEIYTSPLSYGAVPFATALEQRTAKVKLDAPQRIKPGETLKMKLHSDRPARAFVFAVDEGILQVARYKTPDPLSYFFQKRALEVSTLQTLDLILPEFSKLMRSAAPGGDGEGEAGKHLNPFKRKRDKPVAYWSGLVDVNGDREFSYTVPDYFNGSMRVMAVVVGDDAVAAASTSTTVRGDIVLLPTVPTSLSPGDAVDIGIGVSNNIAGSGKAAPIRLALTVNNGLEVVGEAAQTLKINEKGEGQTVFHVRAKAGAQAVLGSSSVIFTASYGGNKATARLSTDLSVRPASPLVTQVQSGTAVGAGELKSRLDAYPAFAHSELAVSATPWAFASGLINYLDAYPYGCTEQIASRTMPAVVLAGQPELAQSLAKSKNSLGQGPFDPRQAINRAVTQLRARQAADGGISLWPGSQPDEFATLYALNLLLEAKDRQVPVPQDMISKANTYLQGRLGSGRSDGLYGWRTRAEIAYVLTRQGILVPAALANLREELRNQSQWRTSGDIGQAYLAASFQLVKQEGVAKELLTPVWNDFVTRMQANKRRDVWGYYYDPLVHDASLIILVSRHFPSQLAVLPADSWDRLARMIQDGWYSTQSSAMTILAVDAYAKAAARSAGGTFNAAAVDKAGKTQALAFSGELKSLSQAVVPAGTAKLKLSNPGNLPLYYGWSESGYDRSLPATADVHGLSVTVAILDDAGKAITEAEMGDEVTVKVSVQATDRDIRQAVVVDILPSGLEPVINSVTGDDEEEGDAQTPPWMRRVGGDGDWSLDYIDVREDRVIFFGDISRQTRYITFKARATNVGQFAMPAAFGEAMYERRLNGRSAAGKFTVKAVGKP